MKHIRSTPAATNVHTDTPLKPKQRTPGVLTIILSLLACIALLHFIAVTHTAYPTLLIDNCDKAIRNADYTKLVPVQAKTQQMDAVQFTADLTGGQPSALIQVEGTSDQHPLDVYVYGCSYQKNTPTLTLLLKQQGLIQGTATLTSIHTLSISQLDTTISTDTSTFLLPLQENIYHEYSWQHDALRQVLFPGMYPVTTRSEAEALQEQANHQQTLPWMDPLATVQQMAQDILRWPARSFRCEIIDNNDTDMHVQLTRSDLHMEVTVALSRLIQHDRQGLWFVTAAQTTGITLNQTQLHSIPTSPLTLQGTIIPGKVHASAALFDHTLTPVHTLNDPLLQVRADGSYIGALFYPNTLREQTGLLLIEALPPPSGADKQHKPHKNTRHNSTEQSSHGQLLLTTVQLA